MRVVTVWIFEVVKVVPPNGDGLAGWLPGLGSAARVSPTGEEFKWGEEGFLVASWFSINGEVSICLLVLLKSQRSSVAAMPSFASTVVRVMPISVRICWGVFSGSFVPACSVETAVPPVRSESRLFKKSGSRSFAHCGTNELRSLILRLPLLPYSGTGGEAAR